MNRRLIRFLLERHDQVMQDIPPTDGGCPDDNVWAELADDLLLPSQLDQLIKHISRCPDCRHIASQIAIGAADASKASDRGPLRLRPALIAAAACLAILVGGYLGLSRMSSRPGAQFVQIERQISLEQYAQAREELGRLLSDTRLAEADRLKARSLCERSYTTSAEKALKHKEYGRAQVELAEAMAHGFKSPRILELRGTAMMATALAMAPEASDKLIALGYVGIRERRLKALPTTSMPDAAGQEAIELLRSAVDQGSGVSALYTLGRSLMATHRYREAAETFGRWCTLEPKNPTAQNAYGLALYADDRPEEAYQAFGRAILLAPPSAAYEFNAAISGEDANHVTSAIRHWKRYLELEPIGDQAEEARRWLSVLEKGTTP